MNFIVTVYITKEAVKSVRESFENVKSKWF